MEGIGAQLSFKKVHYSLPLVGPFLILLLFINSGCKTSPHDMVWIPGGASTMGSDAEDLEGKALEYGIIKPWFLDEHPSHQVRLDPYFIDRHEVTQGQYAQFVLTTGYHPPMDWKPLRFPPHEKKDHPVVFVSWSDAQNYCQWKGKRLPSEAEWERASRGSDGRNYPWGETFEREHANVGGLLGNTQMVGSYETGKSPYGIYDMIGNVWEWTADWYEAYPGNALKSDKFGKQFRVLRGNSWAGIGHFPLKETEEILAHNSRTTFRLFSDPMGSELNDVGFRCAKSG